MTDTSRNILKRLGSTPFPDRLQQIADDAASHIDAQAATIKALMEALSQCAAPCGNWNMQDLVDIATAALAAAKEPT